MAERLTPLQEAVLAFDAALSKLACAGSEREQAVAIDLMRRRLRRELDRVAIAQEFRAA